MSNIDYRPEDKPAVRATPDAPAEPAPALRAQMEASAAAAQAGLNSAPQNPDGHGDYISMT